MGKDLLILFLSLFLLLSPLYGNWQASVGSSGLKVVPPRLNFGPLKGELSLNLIYVDEVFLPKPRGRLALNLPLGEKFTLVWGNLEGNPLIAPLYGSGFALAPHKGGGGEPLKGSYVEIGEGGNYMGGLSFTLPEVTLYLASFSQGVMVGGSWGHTLAGGLLLRGKGEAIDTTYTIPYRALPLARGGVAYLNYTKEGSLKTSLLLRLAFDERGGLGLSNLMFLEWNHPPFKFDYKRVELPPYLGAIKGVAYKTIEGPLRENVINLRCNLSLFSFSLNCTERLYQRPVYANKGQRHLLSLKGVVAYKDLTSLSLLYEWRHNRNKTTSDKWEITLFQKITLWGVDLEVEPTLTFSRELFFSGGVAVRWLREGGLQWGLSVRYNTRGATALISLSHQYDNFSMKGEWQSDGSLTLSFTIFQPS